jgi:hypothetical protein
MAYAVIRKRKRLSNPGRRRRMTAKQIKYFGTKRQRAALRGRRHNPRRRRNVSIRQFKKRMGARSSSYRLDIPGSVRKYRARGRATRAAKRARKKNVGSILVASIPGMNPGRKRRRNKGMTKRQRRRRAALKAARTRRRRHYVARSHNPGRRRRHYNRTHTVIKYRTRRHHNRGHRRHNPGGFTGDLGAVVGVVAGATVNSFAMGFVPASFATGIPGYIASAVIAVLQGQLVGKVFKKPSFGRQMTIGGLTYTAIKVINDFFPTLSLGLSGLGAIAPTGGFFSPQVNKWGSMGLFQAPNTVLNAIAAAQPSGTGMGRVTNFSARRVGRIQ